MMTVHAESRVLLSGFFSQLYLTINPYAAGGYFGQYKMMPKPEKLLKPYHIGTHLRVLGKSFPMSTKMTW